MPEFVRGFVISDVAEVHKQFQQTIRDAERLVALEQQFKMNRGGRKALAEMQGAYRTFNANLRAVAERAAREATKGMVERLAAQRHRPPTGSVPPLKDLVAAVPLAAMGKYETGAVGVANVEFLNRAINPHSRGYGPYWRAVEYGTGQGIVPSQLGRVIYGSFTDAGGANPTAPAAEFGGGGGPHPVFMSRKVLGSSSAGGTRTAGLGTIGKEVEAKHYIKYGADHAAIDWRRGVAETQQRALNELGAIRLSRS